MAARRTRSRPATTCGALDAVAARCRARQQRRDLHALAQRRAHTGRRSHAAGRAGTTCRWRRRGPSWSARCSKASRTTAAGCSRPSRSSSGDPFPWLHFIGGGAQSELWCQIMADVLQREIRQVEHPIRGQRARRGAGRRHRARSNRRRRSRAARADRGDVRTRTARTPSIYDERYREFRVLHKQTSRRTKKHGSRRNLIARSPRAERVRDDSFPMRGWGLPEPGELDRVVIVSPHLDDAVLELRAVHGRAPGRDRRDGVRRQPRRVPDPAAALGRAERVRSRRRRHGRAARTKIAPRSRCSTRRPVHLDFVEHTYYPGDQPVAPEVLAPVLAATLRALDPTPRHRAVRSRQPRPRRDAPRVHARARRARSDDVSWWLYEDNGYKHIPGMLAWRVSTLFRRQLWPTPVCPPVDHDGARKAAAVECYPSQLFALDDDWQIRAKLEAPAPEQFWRLSAPPAGWEGLASSRRQISTPPKRS